MKKTILLLTGLFAFVALQAQWVNNPTTNTFIANTSTDAGEIYISTDHVSGDTYMQWSQFTSTGGWGPKVQRLNFAGEPQWAASGIEPAYQHILPSYSQGFAIAATTDNAVVSCFSTEAGHSVAVKINADGTFAWGEQGIMLFGGAGGSRTELLADDEGGVWALATDLTNSYLCYIDANGNAYPTATISDKDGKMCTFGLMVPAPDGNVFVVYEKEQWAFSYYYEKDVRVVGYNKDGVQITEDIQLMAPQTVGGSYIHHVVPDGLGGGYAYIWHSGLGNTFNTYVFHFDQFGASTITDPNGIPVHTTLPSYMYIDAYATVDPESHDLLIVYQQTDSDTQSQCQLFVNRITTYGERLWGEGMLVLDNGTTPCGGTRIDAFEYGDGFSVIYHKGVNQTGYESTVEAKGYDMDRTLLWTTEMCTNPYPKTGDDNSSGFYGGQNIVAWVNSNTGGLYGQNIGQNGEMGEVTPPTPPTPCYAPKDFDGQYVYDMESQSFGAELTWTAPEEIPLQYHLYREDLGRGTIETIEIDGNATSYYDETGIGYFDYKLTAIHEHCESNFALTANGDDNIFIEVTSLPENTDEPIVTLLKVYTMNGQQIRCTNTEELSRGVYIFQGLTQTGKLVNQKIIVK